MLSSESTFPLSSVFVHHALLSRLNIQTIRWLVPVNSTALLGAMV